MAALKRNFFTAALIFVMSASMPSVASSPSDTAGTKGVVVLLHGLIRSPRSMKKMAKALRREGYSVCNIGYPSTDYPIETLVNDYVYPAVGNCVNGQAAQQRSLSVSFVTHSLGGILVRQLAATGLLEKSGISLGRVVMLGPPNNGSELVDTFSNWRVFGWMNGPAGMQLGTGEGSVPLSLGAANFELGVIAGDGSVSLMSWFLPGGDDGKVTVESTRLSSMRDFILLPVSHTFMMRNREVIKNTVSFLKTGRFLLTDASHIERFQ